MIKNLIKKGNISKVKSVIIFLLFFILTISFTQNIYSQKFEILNVLTVGCGITMVLQNLQNSNVSEPKNTEDIANMVLFLCSDKAKFVTGENINIDGGMSKLMVYHNDYGWQYNEE